MPQDLQEEGQVIKVGSLGERWVLRRHAEPWLLTINSKQRPESCSKSARAQHNIPFVRKRCRQESNAGEPPAKRLAVEQESDNGETAENPPDKTQQQEQADEASGGLQTQPGGTEGMEAGQETPEHKERPEGRMQLRSKAKMLDHEGSEKLSPPSTGPAGQADE